jgi:hypothetical protein
MVFLLGPMSLSYVTGFAGDFGGGPYWSLMGGPVMVTPGLWVTVEGMTVPTWDIGSPIACLILVCPD